ncbi:MAG: 2,3-bisphosphoglycerate-independent phosphoglycerate mutase [Nitrospinaceae bacterium]
MKYLVVIGAGLTDKPIAEKDNQTPLQLADTPNLDRLAREGFSGSVRTIPDSLDAGNDVSFLSLLGFDPEKHHAAPALFDAVALGVELKDGEVPVCCDFIQLQSSHNDMVMKDFTAGNLSDEDAGILLEALQKQICDVGVRFYPGTGHHHLMVIQSPPFSGRLTPPHELVGEGIRRYMPEGEEFKEIIHIMNQAQIILHNHPYNRTRRSEGKDPVNSVWLWGSGRPAGLPPFSGKFHKDAALVTPSLLLRGMGISAGMQADSVPARNGSNSPGNPEPAGAAFQALETREVVFLHVPAGEDVSLQGNIDDKILAIEDFDREVAGPLLEGLSSRNDVKMLFVENQVTSAVLMKYTKDLVPFVVFPAGSGGNAVSRFDEKILDSGGKYFEDGPSLLAAFLKDALP